MKNKVVIIGAGLFGCSVARLLAEEGFEIIIYEKALIPGGNCIDVKIEDGVFYHLYGPHIFHTNDEEVLHFFSKFSRCNHKFVHSVIAKTSETAYINLPITHNTLQQLGSAPEVSRVGDSFIDEGYRRLGKTAFELLIKEYTEKQWGQPCETLSSDILKRFHVKASGDTNYFKDGHDAYLPINGYSNMFHNLLSHSRIKLLLATSITAYSAEINGLSKKDVIVLTCPLDEFYKNCYGELPYRTCSWQPTQALQKHPVVNYTTYKAHKSATRAIDYGLLYQRQPTGAVEEFPRAFRPGGSDVRMYPIRNRESVARQDRYEQRAHSDGLLVGGRLGRFEYNDMDVTIKKAIALAQKIKEQIDDKK